MYLEFKSPTSWGCVTTHDLTDVEWNLIAYCFPKPIATSRPREHSYRELLNAIFYLLRTGCQWRNLPKDLPLWTGLIQ